MSKVSYIDLLPAEALLYYDALKPQSRFIHSRVVMKKTFYSRMRIRGLTQKSLLPTIAAFWSALTTGQKAAWTTAGAEMGLNGWRLFVQDMCARIKNSFSGAATPVTLHQSWVGMLKITAPASELKIAQLHPSSYWVYRKVVGSKNMYEPVAVSEGFSLPLVLSLNYKAELETAGGTHEYKYGAVYFGEAIWGDDGLDADVAVFYAEVLHSYQGVDYLTTLEINLDLVSVWKNATATLSSVIGEVIGYNLYFHLDNVRGTLYIDNVKATHSGQNWVRDPFCNDIYQGFTKAFFQIPKHWAAVTLPDGAEFDSIYKDF